MCSVLHFPIRKKNQHSNTRILRFRDFAKFSSGKLLYRLVNIAHVGFLGSF